jgi:nucleotide-binding universal stress UspA family protein
MTEPQPEVAPMALDAPAAPVLTPAGSTRPRGPIVLGTDFGPASASAERAAIAEAAAEGLELVIVHAIDPMSLRLGGGLWRARVDQVRAARQLDAAALVSRARSQGVAANVLIWNGDAASCILEAARAEDATRIVIGSHGRGRLARAIAGSVSITVNDQAAIPVDVVRAEPA